MPDYEFNILYYIDMYKKWWKKIVLVMSIAMFFTMLFSRLLPTTYISTVTILSTGGGGGGSAGALGKFLGISGISGGSSTDAIVPLLNSRRMATDIRSHFNLDKNPKFRYTIDTSERGGAFAINVKGTDPELIAKIANFVVINLDKINSELDITPNKPMVKVLDPAIHGTPQPRQSLRKIIVAALLSFLLVSLYAFFSDYLRKLKS